jgi:hypothetical protein
VEAIRDPGGVSPFSNASELDALGGSRARSGPPRAKVNDAVSFLWRWEPAGHPRNADAWRKLHDFANSAFPRAGATFSDMHIALAQVVAGNDASLGVRARQMDELARKGRYPSGRLVPAVSHAFAAFERRDFLRRDRRA